MRIQMTLPRSTQIALNGRAVLRDAANRDFGKMAFHLRGIWRALAGI